MKIRLTLFLAITLFFIGCSNKNRVEYNKPDIYWYNKIVYYISTNNLEKADDYFTSLESEHFSSPLLKEALLMLAIAHMDEEEYLLANYYLDEYIKRFADERDIEFVRFLKIKSSYLAFKNINRDQKLLSETIEKAIEYKKEYPNSEFVYMVDTILTKLYMAQYVLNEEVAALYKRRGKDKAAKIYEEKNEKIPFKKEQIDVPTNWYEYLINW